MSSPWIQHIQQYRAANPHLSYKQAMVEAKGSYRSIPKSVPLEGGKLNLKKTANNISKGAKKVHLGNKALTVARVSAPILTVVGLPEVGIPLQAGLTGYDNAKKANRKTRGGSFKAHNVSSEGGSFKVHGAGLQSSSHIMHPSFYPLKPKSYKQLQHEN